MLLIVQTTTPTTDSSSTVCNANRTHPNRRSPPPAVAVVIVGTAFSIIMNDPHCNMNKTKNAMLDLRKDQTTETPLTTTAPDVASGYYHQGAPKMS
jgi:hypothetical protein